jgi:hypothetical protein
MNFKAATDSSNQSLINNKPNKFVGILRVNIVLNDLLLNPQEYVNLKTLFIFILYKYYVEHYKLSQVCVMCTTFRTLAKLTPSNYYMSLYRGDFSRL